MGMPKLTPVALACKIMVAELIAKRQVEARASNIQRRRVEKSALSTSKDVK